jgi:hypothetical protein
MHERYSEQLDDYLKLPWSWMPSVRKQQSFDFYDEVSSDSNYDYANKDTLNSFCLNAEHVYVMPSYVGDMLAGTLLGFPKGEIGSARDKLLTANTPEEHTALLIRFEQEFLGLEPTKATNGLRYYDTSAGFASGEYPTEAVSKTVFMQPHELLNSIDEDKYIVGQSYILVRSGNYVFDVRRSHSPDHVVVTEIYELTELGSAVLELTLRAYDKGLASNNSNNTNA